jgi:NAD dependent epimerase/dehydratase family enzyme
VNLTSPNPVTNAVYTKALGRALHRPAVVPVPAFGPKLLLGSELADALLGDSQRVLPERLLASGYEFRHPDIDEALTALFP